MPNKIVINTSPLLSFGKMQALDIIAKLSFEFVCPAEVQTEIAVGVAQGHTINLPEWVQVLPLKAPLAPVAVAALDSGEAAVIQLALEQNISLVCIDELKGRRAANAVGLSVVGSLGLLGQAKSLGLINRVRPFVEQANNSGIFYDQNLIEKFLQSLGE